jgi:hypothetical protein
MGSGRNEACLGRIARVAVLSVLGTGLGGCTVPDAPQAETFGAFAEATPLWVQTDDSRIDIIVPLDVKPESRNAAWIVEGSSGGLYRFSPPAADYRAMGALDLPPEEIENPARMAFSSAYGLFVYDKDRKQIQLFTPDGTPVRDFAPGFAVSRLELTTRPIGLAMAGVVTADSLPRLKVIRTDLRGLAPDTLLFPGSHGPVALWSAVARGGELTLDAADGGMWALARAVPDTAFELAGAAGGRKRALRPDDAMAFGILTDLARRLLWVVRFDSESEGTIRYAAYDLDAPGTAGPEAAYLGERTTPPGFQPRAAIDGVVIGIRTDRDGQKLAAYDMRVPEGLP